MSQRLAAALGAIAWAGRATAPAVPPPLITGNDKYE